MSAARRLAAILAVDVVGYSRLMGEDEAGTARAVREHRDAARPIVAGLGGRIVKTTGDGLLLEPKGEAKANVVAVPDADWPEGPPRRPTSTSLGEATGQSCRSR